jgi:hypothetical protein
MLLSQSDWAKSHGFTRQYVSKLIRQGTIRLIEGKIDSAAADAALEALRQPMRPMQRVLARDAPAAGGGADLPTLLLKSRIKTEVERGKLLEARAKAETGQTVSADEVKAAAFRKARIVRDGLLNLPDRLAALLAAETDAGTIHTLLTSEIRTILDNLSRD